MRPQTRPTSDEILLLLRSGGTYTVSEILMAFFPEEDAKSRISWRVKQSSVRAKLRNLIEAGLVERDEPQVRQMKNGCGRKKMMTYKAVRP